MLKALSRFFRRKQVPASDIEVRPNLTARRHAAMVSDLALMRARGMGKGVAPKVFTTPVHPMERLNAVPAHAMLANDSAISGTQSWANAQIAETFGSVWDEAVTFLGYAYLSELAQRPEYRMMTETIASEMTRRWIRFTSTSGDDKKQEARIKELDAEFKRLRVRDMFKRATELDGFFGRGHIYIDTGDTEDRDELQKSIGDGWDELSASKIRKGSLEALRVVEPVWCYPTSYNSNDPLKDDWYRPNEWYVQSKIVHSSRLITLIGRPVPDLLKPTYSFGGLSLSQMAKPYVDNWLETRQGVNDIITSFTTWVLKTDLSSAMDGGDGDQLFKRIALFNMLRSNQGTMALQMGAEGVGEEFANVSAPLGSLDQLQAQAQEHLASVSHIPTVKLLGIQPAGLNASSEGELRSFFDWIHAFQESLFRAHLHRLMGIVMLSLWGNVDEDIGFEFEPLWTLDEKGLAEVEKLKAETDQVHIDNGTISQAEARKRIASDADSGYNGLDVDELPDLLEEEESGLEPQGGRPDPDVQAIGEQQRGQTPVNEAEAVE